MKNKKSDIMDQLTTVTGWEVYNCDSQECVVFKSIDLARNQKVFDKSDEVDTDPTTVTLTDTELLQFEKGEPIWV